MKVLLMGRLADQAGWREREAPPMQSVTALRRWVAGENRGLLAALGAVGVLVAVDKTLFREDRLAEGVGEVAFLPPMSGG